jgi:peptide/nickel transport system substrate-binding protein
MKSKTYVFTVSLLILVFLVSCAPKAAPNPTSAPNQPTTPAAGVATATSSAPAVAKRPFVVTEGQTIDDMDPGKNWGWEGNFLALEYDTLFVAKGASSPTIEPWLATEIPTKENGGISADGLVYTIKIRPGAKFHDGKTPVDATAVVYTYTRMQKLATGVDSVTADWITKMEIVDPLTVRFTLKQPFGDFMWSMTSTYGNQIVNPTLVDAHLGKLEDGSPDYGSTWLYDHEAGSGPYSMASVDKTVNTLTLQRNPDWWRGWPSDGKTIDQIIYRTGVDSQSARLMLEKGDIDMALSLDASDYEAITSKAGIVTQKYPGVQQAYIGFNNTSPKLQDLRVRQALLYSFPYESVQKDIFLGNIMPMTTAAGPGYPEVYTPQTVYTQDLAKAQALLAAAGYTPQNPLELTINIISKTGTVNTSIAELWQPILQGIGVKLNIQETDKGVWGKAWWGCNALTAPNMGELSFLAISGDYPSAWETMWQVYPMISGQKCTAVYINDSVVNQLFTDIAGATDTATRKPLFEKLYERLNSQAYALQMGEQMSLIAYRDVVKGYDYSFAAGDGFFPAYAMWLEK